MQLAIDEHYYNKLDIEGFSRMMKAPSYSYKFYWLEAIVQLICENKTEALVGIVKSIGEKKHQSDVKQVWNRTHAEI